MTRLQRLEGPRLQRGLSLVEMLVGLAIGLLVTAAAGALVVGQLHANRRLVEEARLTHDLRATLSLITAHLRRAGHWTAAEQALHAGADSNPHSAVTPQAEAASHASFVYGTPIESGPEGHEALAFRSVQGVLQMRLASGGGWQALTDPTSMKIVEFLVLPTTTALTLDRYCSDACDAGPGCHPVQLVREFDISIRAASATTLGMERTARAHLRLRADAVEERCT